MEYGINEKIVKNERKYKNNRNYLSNILAKRYSTPVCAIKFIKKIINTGLATKKQELGDLNKNCIFLSIY